MAVDQAIAESVGRMAAVGEDARPTLRLYTWSRPTLSLGYFQSSRDRALERFQTAAQVRRSTGGGAILHHHELTYSLVMPTPAGQRGARLDLYTAVHEAIVAALQRFSVQACAFRFDKRPLYSEEAFLCFQRRTDEDLIVSGYKVVGSAQRRDKRAILQHGSVLLRASEYASALPGVVDLSSQPIDPEALGDAVAAELSCRIGTEFADGALTAQECDRAEQIVVERFGNATWWGRR